MIRPHTTFTATMTLPTALLASIEYAWVRDGASYTPTVLFPYLVGAAALLAITLALQLGLQAIAKGYNVTPISPAVALLAAAVVLHLAFAQPHTLASLHWSSPLAKALPFWADLTLFPLAGLAALVGLYYAIRRVPVGFHVYDGTGRTYHANPETIARLAGAAKAKGQNQPNKPAPIQDVSGKPYRAKPPRLTFENLYGNQELKDMLTEAGQGWREQGQNGLLMSGPPGTGKTAFAEALAGELRINFLSVTFGDIASKWVNQTTEQLVSVFEAAIEQGPVMLFIDEIDSVLKDRRQLSMGSNEEYERLVTTFLTRAVALRGTNVFLVAATNFVDRLDEAAIREGRFDFKVTVPLPDTAARWRLTAWRLRENGCTSDDGTLDRLTRRWAGFNVPRIIAVANAACELAKSEGVTALTYDHFYRGLRKIQGRKGGAPEGAKALADLFMEADQAQRLKEIAAQLTRVDEIERLGGSIPKGLLFYGPPGTGKTATAMALARECGWSFIERNGRDLMRDGEVDRLREEASALRPAIVFLDEADDILADRSFSGIKAATNELLSLIDGAGGTLHDVVWVAATNHPEGIDSAALRGGRFEQKIEFGPPSDETALKMVLAWAKDHPDAVMEDPALWAAKVVEHVRGQTAANILSVLRLANNMAVAKHVATGAERAVTISYVAKACAELAN